LSLNDHVHVITTS